MRKQMCCPDCHADMIMKRPCDTCKRNTCSKGNPVQSMWKDNFVTKKEAIHIKASYRGMGVVILDDGRLCNYRTNPSYTKREKKQLKGNLKGNVL